MVVAFGEFAHARGARTVQDLPEHVEPFVAHRVSGSHSERAELAKEVRGPVEQMLRVVLAHFVGTGRRHHGEPFADTVPGFFEYLSDERGLRPATIYAYRHYLAKLESFLAGVGARASEPSPTLLTAFITERSRAGLVKSTVRDTCGVLKVFLRYAHRQGVLSRDLSGAVEWPQVYRLSTRSAVNHLGRGRHRAGHRGPPHPARETPLRDSAAARDLRAAGS